MTFLWRLRVDFLLILWYNKKRKSGFLPLWPEKKRLFSDTASGRLYRYYIPKEPRMENNRAEAVKVNENDSASEIVQSPKQSIEDKIVIRMRKCGRFLLHDSALEEKTDSGVLLKCLNDREKKELSVLLKKCLNEWKK